LEDLAASAPFILISYKSVNYPVSICLDKIRYRENH